MNISKTKNIKLLSKMAHAARSHIKRLKSGEEQAVKGQLDDLNNDLSQVENRLKELSDRD